MYSDYVLKKKNERKEEDVKFIKMHGLGNDFVIIDQREKEFRLTPTAVRRICDRNFGIGCDQLIILRASENFTCQMLIFNADASIARACGNACRCVAKLLNLNEISIQIHDRVVNVTKAGSKNSKELYAVDMGVPLTKWYEIPLRSEVDVMDMKFEAPHMSVGACVNVGNPHLVFFESELNEKKIAQHGPFFESHSMFPDRINVSFAHIVNKETIQLRVWERGTGLTLACGSAACATQFLAYKKGLVSRETIVQQRGGELIISVDNKDAISMLGAASHIFSGTIAACWLV